MWTLSAQHSSLFVVYRQFPVTLSVHLRVAPSIAQSRQPVMSVRGSLSWKDQVKHLAFSEQRTEERSATPCPESVKTKLSRLQTYNSSKTCLQTCLEFKPFACLSWELSSVLQYAIGAYCSQWRGQSVRSNRIWLVLKMAVPVVVCASLPDHDNSVRILKQMCEVNWSAVCCNDNCETLDSWQF